MSTTETSEAIGRGLKIAVLAVVLLIGMAIGWYARGFLMVDKCLDRGGSWNAETLECERASGVSEAEVEHELLDADRAFAAETAERGIEGWVEWFAPEGSMVQGGREVHGREAIHQAMAPFFADTTIRLVWEPSRAEALPGGEAGFTVGPYRVVRPGFGGRAADTLSVGTYLSVWRRGPEGEWRVVADIGSPTP